MIDLRNRTVLVFGALLACGSLSCGAKAANRMAGAPMAKMDEAMATDARDPGSGAKATTWK